MEEARTAPIVTIEDEMHGKYLTFKVHDGEYGIAIKYITEIIGVQDITPVPHTHNFVKGIINLRGTVVPVIDMRLRFNLPEVGYTERTCIIVISMEEMNVGLIVDEVQEVSDISDENTQPPPKVTSKKISNYFIHELGMAGDSVKQILNISKVFDTGATIEIG